MEVYGALLSFHGKRGWWPIPSRAGEHGFDGRGYHQGLPSCRPEPFDRLQICLGTILTQNTSWNNAEKALLGLLDAGITDLPGLLRLSLPELEWAIRPSGYFRQKAARIKDLGKFLAAGGYLEIGKFPPAREALLSIRGIGPETADSILLYAFHLPRFVIDAYTLRLFTRLGLLPAGSTYASAQEAFHSCLPSDAELFSEYHALIVEACKVHCLKNSPECRACPLNASCSSSIRQV